MVRYILYLAAIIILAAGIFYLFSNKDYASDDKTLAGGKTLFEKNCVSCHGLREDGIGPPLGGITKLLSKKALVSFISNPSKVIEAGNERATALHNRYKLMMPSFEWMKEPDIDS